MFETKKDFLTFLRELAVTFLGAFGAEIGQLHHGKSLTQVILSTFLFALPIALSAHLVRGQKKQFRWKGFVLFLLVLAACMAFDWQKSGHRFDPGTFNRTFLVAIWISAIVTAVAYLWRQAEGQDDQLQRNDVGTSPPRLS